MLLDQQKLIDTANKTSEDIITRGQSEGSEGEPPFCISLRRLASVFIVFVVSLVPVFVPLLSPFPSYSIGMLFFIFPLVQSGLLSSLRVLSTIFSRLFCSTVCFTSLVFPSKHLLLLQQLFVIVSPLTIYHDLIFYRRLHSSSYGLYSIRLFQP